MPYKNLAVRRTASREASRRHRARKAAEAAAVVSEAAADSSPGELGAVLDAPERSPAGASVLGPGDGGRIAPGPPHNDLTAGPGAIEDGPAAAPGDDGGFVTLRHRCTTCGVVREVAIPPIEGLGEVEVGELRGRCAQCARTPEAPGGPVLGPVDRGAVLRAPVEQEQRPPYVEMPPGARPSRADVMRDWLAGSPVLVADEHGQMRPAAEVLAEDANRAALAPAPVDPRNHVYEPNLHGKIQSSAGREGQQGPVVVELPATSERAAVTVWRPAASRPARTVYLMPR